MTNNRPAAKTPTVAIARVLRDLGLKQGVDFRVKGAYRNGERIGTYVDLYGAEARQLVAGSADEIEELVEEQSGFAFHVSLTYSTAGNPFPIIANHGPRVRYPAPGLDAVAPRVVDGQVIEPINPYDGLAQKRFGSLTWACRMNGFAWFFQNTLDSRKYELTYYRGRADVNGWYLSDGAGGRDFMGAKLTAAAEACENLILSDMRGKRRG